MLSEDIRQGMGQVRTFSMNPKQRTCILPFLKDASLKEPGCGSLVVSTARNVMVGGRVRWREPSVKVLPQLVSYKVRVRLETQDRCS